MGRPSEKDKKTKDDVEQLRKQVIKNFFGGLSDKMLLQIEASLKATKPCGSCSKGKSEEGKTIHVPGKAVDELGSCAMCHGSYLVPDVQQRQWAVEQIKPIVAPPPKVAETVAVEESALPEMEDRAAALSDADLDKARADLETMLQKAPDGKDRTGE